MFDRLRTPGGVTWLVVFLGNPGPRFSGTRHNVGFMAGDECAKKFGAEIDRLRFKALTGVCAVGGEKVMLMKPQTFMNLSGEAVGPLAAFYKLNERNILVVHDELDLPLGRMKFKQGGGLAGHNGLKSLEACLGSREFIRLRLGIDKPEQGEVVNYVTSRFKPAETLVLTKTLPAAVSALLSYMQNGLAQAMRDANAAEPSPQKVASKNSFASAPPKSSLLVI